MTSNILKMTDFKVVVYFIVCLLSTPHKTFADPLAPPPYSDMRGKRLSSIEILAVNAYHEARSESDIANMMIMAVIENRVQGHKRYGNNVEEVVFKKHAFEWTQDGKPDTIHNEEQYIRLYKLAEKFLLNKSLFVELSEGADHYVKVGHKTNWDYSKLEYIGRFDDHLFYRHK